MEDYSDNYEDYAAGSLRYEKTQNRDITETIERINRSEKFRDSAVDIIKLISPVLKSDSDRIFREIWRNRHDSHTNPHGLVISVDIVPPVMKKVHAEGDTDTYFKAHKEYPFYYLLNLKVSIKFSPYTSDPMKDDEAWYGKWFMDNISPSFTKKMLEKIRSSLDSKFSNIFEFPTLAVAADGKSKKDNEEDKDNTSYELNRINVIMTPVLKFNKDNENGGVNSRFDSTPEMKSILETSFAMALERIIRV